MFLAVDCDMIEEGGRKGEGEDTSVEYYFGMTWGRWLLY